MIPRIGKPCNSEEISSFLQLSKKEKCRLKEKFEKKFSRYIGVKHAIAVSSARIALYLLIKNLQIKKKSNIIVPSYTASIVPYVLDFCNLVPIYVDAAPDNFLMNMQEIKPSMLKNSKAIIATPINGRQMGIDKVLKMCKKYGLVLIEDNAQACGTSFKGKMLGSFGNAAYFSFGFSKQITTLGGGMITTNDSALAQKIRDDIKSFEEPDEMEKVRKAKVVVNLLKPRIFSWTTSPIIGLFHLLNKSIITDFFGDHTPLKNKRIEKLKVQYTNFQAFLGIKQLKELDKDNQRRNEHAGVINNILKEKVPRNMKEENKGETYSTYEIRVKNRQRFIKGLYKKGIDSQITWMKNCGRPREKYPVSALLEKGVVSVPIYPSLSKKEIIYIAKVIKKLI